MGISCKIPLAQYNFNRRTIVCSNILLKFQGKGEIVFYNNCLIVADPLCYVVFTCVHVLLKTSLGSATDGLS